MNQNQAVLEYIRRHGSIDAWRAMRDLRILRLSARIWDLRKAGFHIKGVMREHIYSDGTAKHWKEYML